MPNLSQNNSRTAGAMGPRLSCSGNVLRSGLDKIVYLSGKVK